MSYTKKLLPYDEWRILKIIKVEGHKWNPFFGYLAYTRTCVPTDNATKRDVLDESILNALNSYRYVTMHRELLIRFEGELETALSQYELGNSKDLILNFYPKFPDDADVYYAMLHAGELYSSFPTAFRFRVSLPNTETLGLMMIHSAEMCHIPVEIIDEIVKTIEPM